MKKYFIIVIVLLFLILCGVFYALRIAAPTYNFTVLMTGNVIMAGLSMATFYMVMGQIKNKTDAFVRGVYASSFLKLFVCIVSILLYVMLNKPNVHKPSLFVLFGIYAIYSIAETWMLSRLSKEVK